MNVLVVAATEGEVLLFKNYIESMAGNTAGETLISLLITGVGGIAATYSITKALLSNNYDFALQAGVGGSFNKEIQLGEVVQVMSERYGDLGAEGHDAYLDIFDMGLIAADAAPHTAGKLPAPGLPAFEKCQLRKVSGLTINMVSGNERTIAHRAQKYNCDIESMEGAAFHYVCLLQGVPFAQVRAISNYVTPRDKSQWKMKEAVENLNEWLVGFFSR